MLVNLSKNGALARQNWTSWLSKWDHGIRRKWPWIRFTISFLQGRKQMRMVMVWFGFNLTHIGRLLWFVFWNNQSRAAEAPATVTALVPVTTCLRVAHHPHVPPNYCHVRHPSPAKNGRRFVTFSIDYSQKLLLPNQIPTTIIQNNTRMYWTIIQTPWHSKWMSRPPCDIHWAEIWR